MSPTVFDSAHFAIIFWSLVRAVFVASACLVIGYPAAYFFAVRHRRYKSVFLFFLMIPFWTNFLVHVYSWRHVFAYTPLLHTQWAVNIVMIYSYLPFAMLPLLGALETFDYTLIEASNDLGASPLTTMRRVTLPLTRQAIQTGFLLVLMPVFGEYAMPTLLGDGKMRTVGSVIADYYLEAKNPEMGATFTVLSCGIVLLFAWLVSRLMGRRSW